MHKVDVADRHEDSTLNPSYIETMGPDRREGYDDVPRQKRTRSKILAGWKKTGEAAASAKDAIVGGVAARAADLA